MALSVTKQLICPSCGVVVASASYRRFPRRLIISTLDGVEIPPESIALLLPRARKQLAANPRDPVAADRVAFLERHYEERIVDIPCPQGHTLLRTLAQLARAIRSSPGVGVDLGS